MKQLIKLATAYTKFAHPCTCAKYTKGTYTIT